MRQVASSCIYAVDINPLAVELAKLSIWLKTLAKDKPLSFLNHHIRVGNSLVGTSLAEIEDLAPKQPKKSTKKISDKQAPLFGEEAFTLNVKNAVGQMTQIEAIQADDISDVRRQEKIYDELRQKLQPYEQLAHVWTAREFGLNLNDGEWEAVYTLTLAGTPTPRVQEIMAQAQAIANRRDMRFFHWDVAFPEVFFDANGERRANPGFDAIVGNPPYVRWQSFSRELKNYLESRYEVYNSSADLFLYFYELGIRNVKHDRRLGYITSGTFYNSSSAASFRNYIHEKVAFEWVANFGENQPFQDAEMVYPTIAVMRPGKPQSTFKHYFMDGNVRYTEMGETFEQAEWVDSLSEATKLDEWRFQAKEITNLYKKITSQAIELVDAVNDEIYYGILTGRNEAFYVNEAKKQELIESHSSSEELLRPFLRGQHFRPWYQQKFEDYLIFARQGIDIDAYPAIKTHLESFRETLEPRPDGWRGTWNGRTAGNYKWYEWHDTVAYHEEFAKPKIFGPDIGKLPRFSWDDTGLYCNDKGFIIIPQSISLLSVLNSRVMWFALSQMATPLRLRAGLWQYQAKIQFVKRLPIPELSAAQESELATLAEHITSFARQRYQVHEDFRTVISSDLGNGSPINSGINLYQWWQFEDDAALNTDLVGRRTSGFREIPLAKRAEWRKYLADEKLKHAGLTKIIISEETRLNTIVYEAFGLDTAERALIESATKYPYGEV
jgi:hypothetical protein